MLNNRFLILGANGQLGKEFCSCLQREGMDYRSFTNRECDITVPSQVEKIIGLYSPQIIVNCAAYNAVDQAEETPEIAFRVNAEAVGSMAQICKARGIFLVHYSSDYVFDGKKGQPYIEEDQTCPLNVYGESKLKGEHLILQSTKDYLIFRLSWLIGHGSQNFLAKLSSWALTQEDLKISYDEISVPTFTSDVVNLTLKSLARGLRGLYHLTSSGYCSRAELAQYYFERLGIKKTIVPVPRAVFQTRALRPGFSAMSNGKILNDLGVDMPSWQEELDRYLREIRKASKE